MREPSGIVAAMARAGDVLDIPALGVRVEFRRTTEQTGGELLEFDLVGRPKGFITVPHKHPAQTERHEVIEGRFRIRTGALERVLGPGEVVETGPGVEHSHGAADGNALRVRVTVRPAGALEAWLERVAAIDRDGDYLAGGWPKPVAAARLLLDFEGEAHGTVPPLSVQRAAARAVLRLAQRRR
jgi:quercetin dioxygenase-like cupin family protein